jgi:hypothetical protein
MNYDASRRERDRDRKSGDTFHDDLVYLSRRLSQLRRCTKIKQEEERREIRYLMRHGRTRHTPACGRRLRATGEIEKTNGSGQKRRLCF